MANDEEVMSFEITDQDLDDELNPHRRRPKQSKNRATYGIWAENSDDDVDDDLRPSFGGATKQSKMGPVGFVSAGIQQVMKAFIKGQGFIDFIVTCFSFSLESRKRTPTKKRRGRISIPVAKRAPAWD